MFLHEQRYMLSLANRVAQCAFLGHEDPETIMFHDEMRRVCPRCGKEL